MPIHPMELEASPDHGDEGSNMSSSSSSTAGTPLHRRRRRDNRPRINSYEIEDEEFEEALGLLDHPIANHTDFEEETAQGRKNSAKAWIWWMVTMGLVALLARILHHKENQWNSDHVDERLPPVYDCSVQSADSFSSTGTDESNHEEIDDAFSLSSLPMVKKDSLSATSDNSTGYSYDQLKRNVKNWTTRQIAPFLLQGDPSDGLAKRVTILESSSQTLGLSLYIMLDIMEEMQAESDDPTQFWVYGNDRDPYRSSFSFFRQDDKLQQIPNTHLGIFCAHEEKPLKDLSYIPADTFDLVYTGHLPPLKDPLGFDQPADELSKIYQNLCNSGDRDSKGNLLEESAQEKQEVWFASWVEDMLRVVGTGGLIVIENLSGPYCQNYRDDGGVAKEWWSNLAREKEEEWGIDPSTLRFADDHLQEWRYHVAINKNGRIPSDDKD